ncbi:hypothetical protein K443DRAFT_680597 [Laccaria amethystina LaAM-08-1]|uniref:MICOS complex subunit MIC12 n=1 Tax=Laccaria amethystina LaAM-08-1 TaxID=1095629 RepID=A0A0C9X0L1_9AGAR|nr:hypothetical protein K443DRAFT_680597 [Laccaria amethystina LaAM-08-1]
MSALVGPASGALIAGGVYYGFSNLMQQRTEQLQRDLHTLSLRLTETPALVQAPPSAAARISTHPFSLYFTSQWNKEVARLFAGFRFLDNRVEEWGRGLLYGFRGASKPEDKPKN